MQLMQAGRFADALALLERQGPQTPGPAQGDHRYLRATCLGYCGRLEEAAAEFQRVLELNPNHPRARMGLGTALRSLGRLEEAARAFTKVIAAQPGLAEARLALAQTLLAAGRTAEAEQAYRELLRQSPDHAEALAGLGDCALARGQTEQAQRSYEAALKAAPEHPELHFKIAEYQLRQGLLDQAIDHYRACIRVQPNHLPAILNLAKALSLDGQHDAAYECCEQVLRRDPRNALALLGKARWLIRQKAYDEAWAILEPLLETEPASADLALNYLRLSGHHGRDEDAIRYTEQVLAGNLPPETRRTLLFMLARKQESRGDHAAAFEFFQRANGIVPYPYNPAENRLQVEARIQRFSRDFLQRAPEITVSPSRRLIFVVGMPRSGTSLVEQILDSHPEVAGLGERLDINYIHAQLEQLSQQNPDREPLHDARLLAPIVEQYYERIKALSPGVHWIVDKLPHNFMHLGIISILFPTARIVHCRRNPLDTSLSIYFQDFNASHAYSNDLENIGHHYLDYRRMMQHWQQVLPQPIFNLDYEALVHEPEPIVQALLEFCGLDWEPRCLEFHKNRRIVTTASEDQVTKPLYTSSVERWRRYAPYIEPLRRLLDGI